MPKIFSAYERSSLCEAGRSPESNAFLTDIMNTDPKQTNRNARKSETPSYKYSFWFNEEHIRFKKLLCKSGLEHNRSQFIVKRIFGEEFVVIKRDPSKTQFIARLNDFYFQFQKLGNNYNQIVKAVNSHFSNVAIPHQIAMLEQRTRELKALSIEILSFAKHTVEWLQIRPAGTDHRGRSHVTGGVRSHAPKSFTQAKPTAKTDYITLNEQAGTFIPACC